MNVALSFLLGGTRTGCSGLEGSPSHQAAPVWGHHPHGHASGTGPGRVAGVCCPQHPLVGTEAGSGRSASAATLPQCHIRTISWFGATSTHRVCWLGDSMVTVPLRQHGSRLASPWPFPALERDERCRPGRRGGASGENWPVPIARHRRSPPAAYFPAEVRATQPNTRLLPSTNCTNISYLGRRRPRAASLAAAMPSPRRPGLSAPAGGWSCCDHRNYGERGWRFEVWIKP